MVVAACDFQVLLIGKEFAHLVQRLWHHDQVTGLRTMTGHRDVHFRQAMSVGGDHSHVIGLELPEHAVQDRTALLGAHRVGRVLDQLPHIG